MYVERNASRFAVRTGGSILFALLSATASPTFAALTASMVTDFPTTPTVGQTYNVSLVITNTSSPTSPDCSALFTDACQDEIVTNIKLAPSCTQMAGPMCVAVEPGIFSITSATVDVSPQNNACTGPITVTVSSDVVSFNLNNQVTLSGPQSGGFSAVCKIDFPVTVLKLPTIDTDPAPGIQTMQAATADLQGDEIMNTSKACGVGAGAPCLGRPMFVIGDAELHRAGLDTVNFWGSQWWKNNVMSGAVSNGVASFKGYASDSDSFCGGMWETRPGNSSNPPDTIPDDVLIIVTDTVNKDGPDITGDIKQILVVHSDGGYGPNPGHRGNGLVTAVLCPLQP